MSKILKDIKIVILSIIISFGVSLVYAWNGPISAPPNYNAYTPINISSASQTKSGSLWSGAFLTEGGGYFGGNVGIGITNPQAKLHISGTAGVDGIKFPDGTLQTTACAVAAPPGSETFTTNGTFTVSANVRSITVEVRGGGGGGGTGFAWGRSGTSGGGGGGSGGYGRQTFTVNPGENYSVTVGTGGSPSGTGGTSSFGSFISATGGNPGGNGVNYTPGGGGSGGTSIATYNVTGDSGSSGSVSSGGAGGSGVNGYGAGGSGGYGSCCAYHSGSTGQQGQVIVSW